jgi:hypothetical protein
MRTAAGLIALVAALALPAGAQTFFNLDFEQAQLAEPRPPPLTLLPWSEAIPAWGHSDGDSTEFVYYIDGHLGFSQSYILLDTLHSPFGAASGLFAVGMRSGSFHEGDPGGFTAAFLSQTGTVPVGTRWLSLLSSSIKFSVSINGTPISLQPVDLDPDSPTYGDDWLAYSGEWRGDISSFAGQVVALQITNGSPAGEMLAVDEVRFLPIPEPSTAALLGLGIFVLLLARLDMSVSGQAKLRRRA